MGNENMKNGLCCSLEPVEYKIDGSKDGKVKLNCDINTTNFLQIKGMISHLFKSIY